MNYCEHDCTAWCSIFSAKALAEHYLSPATKSIAPTVPNPVLDYLATQESGSRDQHLIMAQDLQLIQLVASYEQAGLSPEQIAAQDGYQVEAVKAILFARSAIYRAAVGRPGPLNAKADQDALDLTPSDEELANRVFRQLAEEAENEGVRLKAAMRIKDERRKRLDPRAAFGSIINNTTIISLNEHFAKAATALAQRVLPAKQIEQQTVTDV